MPEHPFLHSTSAKHHRFHLLDGLRGIAAILVVPRHILNYNYVQLHPNSYLAVDFFFCLSGFVVAFSYEKRLVSGLLNFREFSLARLMRLYPVAALGTVVAMCELLVLPSRLAWTTSPTLLHFAASLMMLPCPERPGYILFPLNPVFWSLFMELAANAGYGIAARWGSVKNWLLATAIVVFFVGLLRIALRNGDLGPGVDLFGMSVGLRRVGFSFCMGVAAMRLYRSTLHRRVTGTPALWIAAAVVFVLGIILFGPAFSPSGLLLTVGLVFPGLIYLAAHISLSTAWIPACDFLGEMSYPLYVLHWPLVFFIFLLSPMSHLLVVHPVTANLLLICYIAVVSFGAWLVANFYDKPIRRLIAHAIQQWGAPSLVAAPYAVEARHKT